MTRRCTLPNVLQQLSNFSNKYLRAPTTSLRGLSQIGCSSTPQRQRSSGVHPVEDSIPASAGHLHSRHRLRVSILFRCALWKALRSKGIPDILIDLIVDLHAHTGSKVRYDKKLSTRFPTASGVRQGCILAPALLCIAIDWILHHMTSCPE